MSDQSVPLDTNPKLTITISNDSNLGIEAVWPKGTDPTMFANILAMLVSGNLTDHICEALAITGQRNQEPNIAIGISRLLMKTSAGAQKRKRRNNPNRPVVLPSEAVRYNMRPHRI